MSLRKPARIANFSRFQIVNTDLGKHSLSYFLAPTSLFPAPTPARWRVATNERNLFGASARHPARSRGRGLDGLDGLREGSLTSRLRRRGASQVGRSGEGRLGLGSGRGIRSIAIDSHSHSHSGQTITIVLQVASST